jgi:tripartite-type tricarboxylate transporter receptor subunit TctC
MKNRRFFLAATGAAVTTSFSPSLLSQTSSDRSIRLLVGFAPGGAVDSVARLLAVHLAEILGQSVVVENRPGASANIAALNLVQSPADGLTILMGAFAHSVNPSLIKIGYDLSELMPLIQITRVPTILLVNRDSPYKTATELIAAGRSKPQGLTYGSGGSGTASHLAPELFARRVGIKVLHVPYKGGLLAMQAVMAGDVDFMCENPQPTFMSPGSPIRPLAVFQPNRLSLLPDVPSIQEAGFKQDLTIRSWHGLFLRKGTPEGISTRILKATQEAMARPQLRARINAMAIETVESNPQAFASFFASEVETWGKVIKDAQIKAD